MPKGVYITHHAHIVAITMYVNGTHRTIRWVSDPLEWPTMSDTSWSVTCIVRFEYLYRCSKSKRATHTHTKLVSSLFPYLQCPSHYTHQYTLYRVWKAKNQTWTMTDCKGQCLLSCSDFVIVWFKNLNNKHHSSAPPNHASNHDDWLIWWITVITDDENVILLFEMSTFISYYVFYMMGH